MAKNKLTATAAFDRRAKRFLRKFPALEQELDELGKELLSNPELGTSIGAGMYKIRLASKSKGGGKSGGFRVVTYLLKKTSDSTEVFLLVIYDKSEEASINIKALKKMIEDHLQ